MQPAPRTEPPRAVETKPQQDLFEKAPAPRAPRPARQAAEKPVEGEGGYVFPPLSLLDDASEADTSNEEQYVQEKAKILEDTLAEFGVSVKVVGIETGPVITQYELELAPGIKVDRVVVASADDIAMALKAPSVRIVAPIPGRDSSASRCPTPRRRSCGSRGSSWSGRSEKAGMVPVYIGRGRRGRAARGRPHGDAAPPHRGRDRRRQVRLHQLDHPLRPDAPAPRRREAAARGPEDGGALASTATCRTSSARWSPT